MTDKMADAVRRWRLASDEYKRAGTLQRDAYAALLEAEREMIRLLDEESP